ncbi:MAG TPA: BON domain-containing protein [Steroidobacteraceae bacterium]|nr:BON domain-containing protein [Steroidobacteraceae bacterium]
MSRFSSRFAFILPLVMVSLIGCASTRSHESPAEYVDDSVITLKVKTAIFADETLKSSEVNVETFKGVVQLSGFVNSQADIQRAVAVAGEVGGVKSVKNDMQLKR